MSRSTRGPLLLRRWLSASLKFAQGAPRTVSLLFRHSPFVPDRRPRSPCSSLGRDLRACSNERLLRSAGNCPRTSTREREKERKTSKERTRSLPGRKSLEGKRVAQSLPIDLTDIAFFRFSALVSVFYGPFWCSNFQKHHLTGFHLFETTVRGDFSKCCTEYLRPAITCSILVQLIRSNGRGTCSAD